MVKILLFAVETHKICFRQLENLVFACEIYKQVKIWALCVGGFVFYRLETR